MISDLYTERSERPPALIACVSGGTAQEAAPNCTNGSRGLARHFRESEGLSIKQLADRLGRSPATVKA